MSSAPSPVKQYSPADLKSHKGFKEGKLYEKLILMLLAKRGYDLSKPNSAYANFAIGKEVSIGKDSKFDDIIFTYEDTDGAKNLIFVQIKHKQDVHKIDSQVLSAEASTAKGGLDGGLKRDFNLQKYFISYRNEREQLKSTTCEELRNGKMKYVVLFTNVALDTDDLVRNGFSLGEAPDDVKNLFALKIPLRRTQDSARCVQLNSISEDLRRMLQKSSDLHRLARVLARYAVWETYREKNILGTDETPTKHYHIMLGKHVIEISDQIQNISTGKKKKILLYCDAKFRDGFVYNKEEGPKLDLLRAILEAVRELDPSKNNMSDDDLKNILKGVEFKVVSHFGKSKSGKKDLLDKWMSVDEDDINDFLKCLVFFVNQPDVTDLLSHMYSENETFLAGTRFGKVLHNMNPKFRDRLEKDLGIYAKDSNEKVWLSGKTVSKFVQEQQEALNISIVTLMYEDEAMQYGRFTTLGKLTDTLDSFLNDEKQQEKHHSFRNALCLRTPMTLFSAIKILQYLSATNYRDENGQISTKAVDLDCKAFRERIAKAFRSESHNLLTIECRETISEQFVDTFYGNLLDIIKRNPNKKIILIIKQNESNVLAEKFKSGLQNLYKRTSDAYVEIRDDINLQDFEPIENPLKKENVVFQGQKQKLSLATLTGITNWNNFIDYLYQENIRNKQNLIDIMTQILTGNEHEIGSKPPGITSLEGAYAKMSEKVNVETLTNQLLSLGSDTDTGGSTDGLSDNNDMYIISGINGNDQEERLEELIDCLGQSRQKSKIVRDEKQFENHLSYIVRVNKLKIVDDSFEDENFYEFCQDYSHKQVFWICVKYEKNVAKFYLEQFYNPNFYLKRTFQMIEKVVIQKEVKELLMEDSLSEIFIFHCDTKELRSCFHGCDIEWLQASGKILIFTEEAEAKATFEDMSRKRDVETVHWLKVEEKQIIWCSSYHSLNRLQMYIDEKNNKISLIDEDNLIESIKDKKILIIADDPGMGKTSTLTNLYESNNKTNSILETHWVIKIHLKDKLKSKKDIKLIGGITDIDNVVKFLSKFDSKLSHSLTKVLLRISLDKNKIFTKPLLLAFDGFDEVLDVEVRNKIILLFKFLKDETAAKLWITTRLHYKHILENKLSSFAIEFNPLDNSQKSKYVTNYLKKRLYLTLNEEKYAEFFCHKDKKQANKNIEIYIAAFLYKMESIFTGDVTRFIGTPLQLSLMLEGSERHLKKWLENDDGEIPVLNYIGSDLCEIYEHYISGKYYVYFQKRGNRERVQERLEKATIDRYHKNFAVSKIFEVTPDDDFKQCKEIFLLVGVIKSQGNNMEFIHKTFEEFFASKACIDWIKSPTKTDKQEYLLTVILLKPDYQLLRTFIDFQLQKLTEQSTEGERQDELEESLKYYGETLAKLIRKKNSPLIDVSGTPLHIAVLEGNKNIVLFLLKSLEAHPVALKKFLFTAGLQISVRYNVKLFNGTALHLACWRDDVEIVKVLLDKERIPEDTLQEFLKCSDNHGENALLIATSQSNNDQIFKELWERANNKLDLILTEEHSALCMACRQEKEELVDILLQEFQHEKHSLKTLLLHHDFLGNPLYYADSMNIVEKLIVAAKLIEDNNKTLKNMLLPEKGVPPLNGAVSAANKAKFEKLLNAAKEMDDDNHTLIQLLMNERYKITPLHAAAQLGLGDFIKLLLETASGLGLEILEKLITAVDRHGNNAIHIMFEEGHEAMFGDSFKMLEEDKYENIWKNVMKMVNNVISEESDVISEESDSLEKSDDISEESDDRLEESDDWLEESDDISEESDEIFKVLYDSSEEMA